MDGEHVRFTHTTKRAKYRNLQRNPAMCLLVTDPEDPMCFVELGGPLVEAIPDLTGAFFVRLGQSYGNATQQPPPDSAERVILVMDVRATARH